MYHLAVKLPYLIILSSINNWNWNWPREAILRKTHLQWEENYNIGNFLVNFRKWSEQLHDRRLSTAQDSGCFRLYVSQTTVTSNFCSTKVYIYILSFFFSTKSIWNTETKSSQIFNYTQVTNEDVKPSGSHYMANKLHRSLTF